MAQPPYSPPSSPGAPPGPPRTASGPASLRIAGQVARGPAVSFYLDGQSIDAFAGESVAAALFAGGQRALRNSPRAELPRGMFCLMGSCQECLVWAGARKLASCQLPVSAGLVVETLAYREQQHG
ncbi:MAG: (2Fe-2S)-binding protein [Burkholderiales bacterium]|nr:MAG: (2Fe-2S)-binding protein [Burkholderiales bacterium]